MSDPVLYAAMGLTPVRLRVVVADGPGEPCVSLCFGLGLVDRKLADGTQVIDHNRYWSSLAPMRSASLDPQQVRSQQVFRLP